MKKNFKILVHYDVCFSVQTHETDITEAIRRAINETTKMDLNDGEIMNVEAFVDKISETEE